MKLIKVKDGLLEKDNFYLTSSFDDFLAQNITHREDNNFFIDANTIIEREFYYNQFVIFLEKENWADINDTDSFKFYIQTNLHSYGIMENKANGQSKYLKIVGYDNYIQCYSSNDNITWNNIGGAQLAEDEKVIKQCFYKYSNKSIQINEYRVYSSPYITLENQRKDYKVELYDSNNNLIITKLFQNNMTCNIFLNIDNMSSYIKLYNTNNDLVYTSDSLNLQNGDVYDFSPYDLSLYYDGIDITDEISTFIQQKGSNYLYDKVTLKNDSSTENYKNLVISTYTYFDDIITLSLDNTTYSDSATVMELDTGTTVDIYICIEKGFTNGNFNARNFKFQINNSIKKGLSKILCDFNTEDKDSYYKSIDNEEVIFDGTIHINSTQLFYYPFVKGNQLDEGVCETTDIVDKTKLQPIISIEDISDDLKQQLKVTCDSQDIILTQKEDYDLSAIYGINYFRINGTNLTDEIKIVFSIDSGNTWLYYDGSIFKSIPDLTVAIVKQYGNNILTFNGIAEQWNDIIINDKIRFAYLLTKQSAVNNESIDSIELNYNIIDNG